MFGRATIRLGIGPHSSFIAVFLESATHWPFNISVLHRQHFRQKVGKIKTLKTRMWANAQPDGRPAEYRWRPLFNAAKFG